MARITLDGIAHTYDARSPNALERIDHVWEQGRAYALLGPSGCGKTTLLNIISGLITPSAGRVLFDGKDVTHLPTERRNIAQVFQFPVIYDTMTVAQNLAFPLKNRGVERGAIKKRVAEIAALLGLTEDLPRRAQGHDRRNQTEDFAGARSGARRRRRCSLRRAADRDRSVAEMAVALEAEGGAPRPRSVDDLRHARSGRSTDIRRRGRSDERRTRTADRDPGTAVRAAGAHLRRLFHRLARNEFGRRQCRRQRRPRRRPQDRAGRALSVAVGQIDGSRFPPRLCLAGA